MFVYNGTKQSPHCKIQSKGSCDEQFKDFDL